MLKVTRTTSDNNNFRDLINLLDNELNIRYGVTQKINDVYNKIDSINTAVIVYFENNPIGCGCFKPYDNYTVEIKRMFVRSENRNSGIANSILQELERWARENNFSKSILETGIKQPEAIKFYKKMGYSKIDNYGPYIDNPTSICMSKKLN